MKIIAFLLGIFCCCNILYAWESYPEYETLTEIEQASFDDPSQLGSESESDALTYTKPFLWEHYWLNSPKAIDISVGSISPAHFRVRNRLKLHQFFQEKLEFRFLYFEDGDRERESKHTILEAIFWPWKEKIGFAIYGEPALFKRKDDVGLALLWQPWEQSELRLFYTYVDITRNKRNDRNDSYIKPDVPRAIGFSAKYWNDKKEFFKFAVRWETKTRWLFPDQKLFYNYRKRYFSLFARKQLEEKFYFEPRFQYDFKFESQDPTEVGSDVADIAWQTKRWKLLARFVQEDFLSPGNELWFGNLVAWRKWHTNNAKLTTLYYLPHFWWYFPAFGSGATQDQFGVSYEVTIYRASGEASIRAVGDRNSDTEHRLNLSYSFRFKNKAELKALFTADLDEFGSSETWEGGNIQFRMDF